MSKTAAMTRDFVDENRTLLAVAESCWRAQAPSYSWHVFDWMAWKLRRKYPLISFQDRIINFDQVIT
jgi:disulfide oxidoreductase YuzD